MRYIRRRWFYQFLFIKTALLLVGYLIIYIDYLLSKTVVIEVVGIIIVNWMLLQKGREQGFLALSFICSIVLLFMSAGNLHSILAYVALVGSIEMTFYAIGRYGIEKRPVVIEDEDSTQSLLRLGKKHKR